jgi:hypothetical protein
VVRVPDWGPDGGRPGLSKAGCAEGPVTDLLARTPGPQTLRELAELSSR